MKILNDKYKEYKKLELGGGRKIDSGFLNLDIMAYEDDGGVQKVDIVIDLETEKLPFEDNSIEVIKADNVFEHLGDGFIFCLNECHRVLKDGGVLKGCVPVAGSRKDFMDVTHKRHFILDSFNYICGQGLAKKDRPAHPKYADYGIFPWNKIKLEQIKEGDLIDMILFELSQRKI